jgi:hypothetical protein
MKEFSMLSCSDAAPLIARHADGSALDDIAGAALEKHLGSCAACRALVADQRLAVDVLRSRPVEHVSRAFASRLAGRLDDESGFLGIADWRTWTLRLAPVAAAAVFAAALFSGAESAAPVNLEEWAVANADTTSRATLLWNTEITADSVLETMLVGENEGTGGTNDVR